MPLRRLPQNYWLNLLHECYLPQQAVQSHSGHSQATFQDSGHGQHNHQPFLWRLRVNLVQGDCRIRGRQDRQSMHAVRCKPAGKANGYQIGTLDDANALSDLKPGVELFAKNRIPWVEAVAGTQQKDAMS
ncbi:hypothetical protein PMIN02_000649 [Paraphaeosphaeria minitans]